MNWTFGEKVGQNSLIHDTRAAVWTDFILQFIPHPSLGRFNPLFEFTHR